MKTPAPPPPLLTAPQVAARLRVPLHRAYELIREHRIPAVRIGRQVRVDPDALELWIKSGGTASEERDQDL